MGASAPPEVGMEMVGGGQKSPHKHQVASRSLYQCSLGHETGALTRSPSPPPPRCPPPKTLSGKSQEAVLTKGRGSQGAAWSLRVSRSSAAIAPGAVVPIRV